MQENNVLGMMFVKHLLSQIPSVTLLADMTGPVCTDTDGTVLTAQTGGIRQTDFNLDFMEYTFANHKVALYQVLSCGRGWKAGDTIKSVDANGDVIDVVAQTDGPERFIIRYAKIPK